MINESFIRAIHHPDNLDPDKQGVIEQERIRIQTTFSEARVTDPPLIEPVAVPLYSEAELREMITALTVRDTPITGVAYPEKLQDDTVAHAEGNRNTQRFKGILSKVTEPYYSRLVQAARAEMNYGTIGDIGVFGFGRRKKAQWNTTQHLTHEDHGFSVIEYNFKLGFHGSYPGIQLDDFRMEMRDGTVTRKNPIRMTLQFGQSTIDAVALEWNSKTTDLLEEISGNPLFRQFLSRVIMDYQGSDYSRMKEARVVFKWGGNPTIEISQLNNFDLAYPVKRRRLGTRFAFFPSDNQLIRVDTEKTGQESYDDNLTNKTITPKRYATLVDQLLQLIPTGKPSK